MVIKRLVMHNFGVYASTNIFEFTGKKPVVLVGGMNGRGKTTILEAVLLSLYGSNSFAYTESKYQSYGQYLKSYVNKKDKSLYTYVEIEFSMDGTDDDVYYVHREWDANGQRIHEKVWVKKNGEDNSFLTENWPMFVENILPSALSSFFFFDGEKIAELAVEETSSQMKESIKAMLGISVLDVLDGDVGRIISKLGKKVSGNQDIKKLEELREKKDKAIEELASTDAKIAELLSEIEELKSSLEKKNAEYAVKGGDIVDQKHELMQQRTENLSALSASQELLLEMSAGDLPLVLVQPLLCDILKKGEAEHEHQLSVAAYDKVKRLYDRYDKKNTDLGFFVDYIKRELESEDSECIYDLSDAALYQVSSLCNGQLEQTKRKTAELKNNRDNCQKKVNEIDSYLSVDIDEKFLNELFKEIKALEMKIATIEVEIDNINLTRTSQHGAVVTAESEFSRMAESVLASLETVDADERTIKYAHMVLDIINLYRIRLQERKTDVLAKTMTNCYKQLANKKNLVAKIEMDSETLDLRYLNGSGEEISKNRLSAGEKQLMVISLLWALAICSKKKLPVIIDTPLSRLDSAHRSALITTYFPKASDQTIILSTDSEIDEKYYEMMQEYIGDEFTLKYDDEEKRTTISQGYFSWGGKN